MPLARAKGKNPERNPNARQREIAARLQQAADRSLNKAKERKRRGFTGFTRGEREAEILAQRAGAPRVERAASNRQ